MSENKETRGRPRSTEADRVILETTVQLLMEKGFAEVSIEGVAAAAGVGKTTIYRRYPNGKLDLVIDAIASAHLHLQLHETPDTGSIEGDLLGLFAHPAAFQLIGGPGFTLIGSVISERESNPALLEAFRVAITEPRRKQYNTIVTRAKERGEVKADVDAELVGQMIFGAMIARNLMGGEVNIELLRGAVRQVLSGIAA